MPFALNLQIRPRVDDNPRLGRLIACSPLIIFGKFESKVSRKQTPELVFEGSFKLLSCATEHS